MRETESTVQAYLCMRQGAVVKCVVCLKKSLCLYSIWSSLPIANCHMHAAWHLLAVAVATVHGGCTGGHMAISAVLSPSKCE